MATLSRQPGKPLGVFALVMMAVIAVDSIRTLPISATFGSSLLFYYLLAGLGFLLPSALVSAELASTWPRDGGIYVWVSEAFGKPCGFLVAWLQWVYNIIWYPTIMALLATTLLYLVKPSAAHDNTLIIMLMLALFWLTTGLTCLGMRASSFLSTCGTIIGTIAPIFCIVALATAWMYSGKPMHVIWSWQKILPHANLTHMSMLSTILFGLIGMEVTGAFAGDVKNPQRDYPRALFIAACLILVSLVLGSLAIAIVVPSAKLNLASGVMEAFSILLDRFHLGLFLPVAALCIFIGGMGNLSPWIIGPSKCLMVASREGVAPACFATTNRFGAPYVMLLFQAGVFTALAFVFTLFPQFNSAYVLLSIMTAQLALIVYGFMFCAVIRLRLKQPETPRPFRLPGNTLGLFAIPGCALLICAIAFAFGLVPPPAFGIHHLWRYEALLLMTLVASCGIPFVIYYLTQQAKPPAS